MTRDGPALISTIEGLLRSERRATDGSLRDTCIFARTAVRLFEGALQGLGDERHTGGNAVQAESR